MARQGRNQGWLHEGGEIGNAADKGHRLVAAAPDEVDGEAGQFVGGILEDVLGEFIAGAGGGGDMLGQRADLAAIAAIDIGAGGIPIVTANGGKQVLGKDGAVAGRAALVDIAVEPIERIERNPGARTAIVDQDAPAADAGIRVVHIRSGLVLTPRGGMLARLLPLARFGLCPRFSSGRQVMSWISLADEIGAIRFLLGREDLSGPVNLTAPAPATNAEFTAAL